MEQQFLYIQELLSNMNFDNIILIGNFPSRHNIEAFRDFWNRMACFQLHWEIKPSNRRLKFTLFLCY